MEEKSTFVQRNISNDTNAHDNCKLDETIGLTSSLIGYVHSMLFSIITGSIGIIQNPSIPKHKYSNPEESGRRAYARPQQEKPAEVKPNLRRGR